MLGPSSLADVLSWPCFLLDRDLRCIAANGAAATWLGRPAESLRNRAFGELVGVETSAVVARLVSETGDGAVTRSELLAAGAAEVIVAGSAELVHVVLRNLGTDRSGDGAPAALAAGGTPSDEIAHDLNNMLFGILGYAELVRMDLRPGSLAARNLLELMRAAQRARDLVGRLRVTGGQTAPGARSSTADRR